MKKILFSLALLFLTGSAAMSTCYGDQLHAGLNAPAAFVNVSGTGGTTQTFFVGVLANSWPPDCNPSTINFNLVLNLKNSSGTVVYTQTFYPSCGSYNSGVICDPLLLCPYQHLYKFGPFPGVPFMATFTIPNQTCGQYMVEALVSNTTGTNMASFRNIVATNVGGGTTTCGLGIPSCSLGNIMIVNFSGTGGLTAGISSTSTICGGSTGTATLTASGGLAPYTYAWMGSGSTSSTATSLAAGTYTATVTDANGCAFTRTVTVTNTPLLVTITPGSQTVCRDKCLTLVATASPAGAYTYTWTRSINGGPATAIGTGSSICVRSSTPGSNVYTVTVSNGAGCSGTASVTITVNANCTVAYNNGCCGSGGGGRLPGQGEAVETAVNPELSVSPNPAGEEVSILFNLPGANGSIEIYTLDGQLVQRIDGLYDKGTIKLTTGEFASGIYIVNLLNENTRVLTEKLVISK